MNEVQVSEGSVFTYRLSNGTHVLIHQSSIEQGKGTEELDCDEEVPLLFLEDGQITYNGIEVTIPLMRYVITLHFLCYCHVQAYMNSFLFHLILGICA
jgi:hypothetical protein